jgi:predicted Zn-ribbon and HTH transcriptional regulator
VVAFSRHLLESKSRPRGTQVFWLISLLLPSHRRDTTDRPFDNFSLLLKTPQSRGLLFKIVGLLLTAGLIWLIIAGILSLLNAWMVIAIAVVMGGVVFERTWKEHRRETWIQTGRCAQCGYDLRATPDRCPECGRDAMLDEPIWRRMRRELEAKLLADAEQTPPPLSVLAEPKPKVRVVTKNPQVDDAPIPLEGD